MKNCHPSLAGFPVIVPLTILWGDEDAFGHVNNIMYLRWAETARVEYLKRIGLWPVLSGDIGPILASISCHFRRALNYPDTVLVGSRVTRVGHTSFRMEHRIVSRNLDVVSAELESTIVALNYKTKEKVPVPESVRKAIEEVERTV